MSDQDEVLGYLRASVERNSAQMEHLTQMFIKHSEGEAERTEEIMEKLQVMRDELNMYKTAIKVVKALGWSAAFVLAFKFGEIPDLWKD